MTKNLTYHKEKVNNSMMIKKAILKDKLKVGILTIVLLWEQTRIIKIWIVWEGLMVMVMKNSNNWQEEGNEVYIKLKKTTI